MSIEALAVLFVFLVGSGIVFLLPKRLFRDPRITKRIRDIVKN